MLFFFEKIARNWNICQNPLRRLMNRDISLVHAIGNPIMLAQPFLYIYSTKLQITTIYSLENKNFII